jgi:hypothetical protein
MVLSYRIAAGGASRQQASTGGDSAQAGVGAPQPVNATTGGWGLSSLVSAIANADLKGLVDDITPGADTPVPPTTPSAAGPGGFPARPMSGGQMVPPPMSMPGIGAGSAVGMSVPSTAATGGAVPPPVHPSSRPPARPAPASTMSMSMSGGVPRPGNVRAPPPSPTLPVQSADQAPAGLGFGDEAGAAVAAMPPAARPTSRTPPMPYPGAANPPPASSMPNMNPGSFPSANNGGMGGSMMPPASGNFSMMQVPSPQQQQFPGSTMYTPAPMSSMPAAADFSLSKSNNSGENDNSPPRRAGSVSATSDKSNNNSPSPSIVGSVNAMLHVQLSVFVYQLSLGICLGEKGVDEMDVSGCP